MVAGVGLTAAIGWHFWDSLWLGLVGLWPALKSTLSAKALWALLKKLPWLALAGVKKYALKLIAATMSVQLSTRIGWVQRLIEGARARIGRLTELLTAKWHTLNLLERALLLLLTSQVLLLLLAVLLLSKSLQLLALKSGSESTAEQLVKRSIPKSISERLNRLGEAEPAAPDDDADPPPPKPG